MIEYYKRSDKKSKIEKVKEPVKGCWVSVVNPTDSEIDFLAKEFDIDSEQVRDGMDIHETPRVDSEANFIYIHSTVPTETISQDHDSSFLIIIKKDYFFTVSKHKLEIVDSILEQKNEIKNFSNSKNLFRILFGISRAFENSVGAISREIKKSKFDISKIKTKDLEKLIKHEDRLTSYTSSFGATIHIYHKIIREKSLNLTEEDREEIEDLIIDLNETLVLCNETLQSISNRRNYYNAKLSNDLNKTVLILTMATVFLSIPTIIGGLYGMNIPLPYQEKENAFYLIFGVIFVIWIGMFFLLKKLKIF